MGQKHSFYSTLISAKCGGTRTVENTDCQTDDSYYGAGAYYQGYVNVTRSGLVCQNWNSQSPHKHKWGKVGDHNFCRNPDGEPAAWCYTMDSKRWEFCDIRIRDGCDECDAEWDKKTRRYSEWECVSGKKVKK